jgi:NAD(P)H-dependent FMN reductase
MYKIATICGSLRKASVHAGLLRAFIETKDSRYKFQWI